jgi:hypothetical protein
VRVLPKESAAARRNASVYLECPLDLDGLIRNAATRTNSLSLIALSAGEWTVNVQFGNRLSNGTITSAKDTISGSLFYIYRIMLRT